MTSSYEEWALNSLIKGNSINNHFSKLCIKQVWNHNRYIFSSLDFIVRKDQKFCKKNRNQNCKAIFLHGKSSRFPFTWYFLHVANFMESETELARCMTNNDKRSCWAAAGLNIQMASTMIVYSKYQNKTTEHKKVIRRTWKFFVLIISAQ